MSTFSKDTIGDFGVPGVVIEPTLSNTYDPYSGIDLSQYFYTLDGSILVTQEIFNNPIPYEHFGSSEEITGFEMKPVEGGEISELPFSYDSLSVLAIGSYDSVYNQYMGGSSSYTFPEYFGMAMVKDYDDPLTSFNHENYFTWGDEFSPAEFTEFFRIESLFCQYKGYDFAEILEFNTTAINEPALYTLVAPYDADSDGRPRIYLVHFPAVGSIEFEGIITKLRCYSIADVGDVKINTDEYYLLDDDTRPSLGLFATEDNNTSKENFTENVPNLLFQQISTKNLVSNGQARYVESNQFKTGSLGEFSYKPAGGWDYLGYDGAGFNLTPTNKPNEAYVRKFVQDENFSQTAQNTTILDEGMFIFPEPFPQLMHLMPDNMQVYFGQSNIRPYQPPFLNQDFEGTQYSVGNNIYTHFMPEGTQLPGFFDAMLIPQSIFTNKTEEEQRDMVVGLDLFCQAKGYDRVRLLPDTEPDGIHFEYLPFDQGGLRVNNNNDELSFSLFPPMFPGNDLPYISKMTCEKIDVEVSNLQNTEDGQFGYAGYFPYLKISDEVLDYDMQWAKWVLSDECFSFKRCLQFTADDRWEDVSNMIYDVGQISIDDEGFGDYDIGLNPLNWPDDDCQYTSTIVYGESQFMGIVGMYEQADTFILIAEFPELDIFITTDYESQVIPSYDLQLACATLFGGNQEDYDDTSINTGLVNGQGTEQIQWTTYECNMNLKTWDLQNGDVDTCGTDNNGETLKCAGNPLLPAGNPNDYNVGDTEEAGSGKCMNPLKYIDVWFGNSLTAPCTTIDYSNQTYIKDSDMCQGTHRYCVKAYDTHPLATNNLTGPYWQCVSYLTPAISNLDQPLSTALQVLSLGDENQYRALNQYQQIYFSDQDTELNPYSSLKVSFWMKTTESNEVIESNDTSGEVLNYENPVVEIGITKNNPEGTGEFNLEEFETDYSYEIYPDEDTTPNGKDVYYETGKFDPLPNILLYDDDGGAQVYNQYDFKYDGEDHSQNIGTTAQYFTVHLPHWYLFTNTLNGGNDEVAERLAYLNANPDSYLYSIDIVKIELYGELGNSSQYIQQFSMCNIPFQTGNQDWDTDSSIDYSFEDNGNNPVWTGRVSLPRQYSDYPTSTAVFDSPNESFHLDYNGNTNGYKIPVRFKLSSSSIDRLEFRFTFEFKVVDSKGLFQTVQNEINYLSTNYNEQYNQSIGSHNSISSFGSSEQKNFGAMNRFSNTKLNLWENFSYVFNLSENYINNEDTNNLQNMWFIIQSSGIGVNTGFNGTVYLDDFEIRESYEFQPDVDVRMKKGPNEYGTADLTKYYDKDLQPEQYKDTTAPLEAQFYFYPIHYTNNPFEEKKSIIYNDFRKGMFYLYDIDWGDGSPPEFASEPKLLGENISVFHTYEKGGIFEIKGTMLRMKPDKNYEPLGVIHNKRFTLRININEGLDEDFKYFGSDGFSFIPYKNTLPIIGGYSKESIYYKSTSRQLGIIRDTDGVEQKIFDGLFENKGYQLKTELALDKINSSFSSNFNLLNGFKEQRYDSDNNLIYNGIPIFSEELGNSIGNTDLTNIRYFNKPMQLSEMFGFEEGDLEIIGNPNNDRYWKNIIPKDYSIFNREGIDLESENEAKTIDIYSEQNFTINNYYPVLPKYQSDGTFVNIETDEDGNVISGYPLMNEVLKIPFPSEGPITNENFTDSNLLISIGNENLESNVFNDYSGNNNFGFGYNDYRPNFDKETLEPKKTRTTSLFKTSKNNGAF